MMTEDDFKKLYISIVKDEKEIYVFKYEGLDCCIKRHRGHLNGYVSIPISNKLYGCNYYYYDLDESKKIGYGVAEAINNIQVHGGLTFARGLPIDIEGYDFSHCLGFDTAHLFDAYVDLDAKCDAYNGIHYYGEESTYKDYKYVRNEVEELVNQINKIL